MKKPLLAVAVAAAAFADGPGRMESMYSPREATPSADPQSTFWKNIPGVFAEKGPRGEPAPGHRTEIRSRWTGRNFYFLFICPYQQLHSKPEPTTASETNKLWDWDVAEVFIGADFEKIWHYREFEVSPHGEWVDLDIDRKNPQPEGGWLWNSGFKSKARIDEAAKIWYCEMQIPIASVDSRPPQAGNEFRVNFYRIQGAPPNRVGIAWQPTGQRTYHVPEAFGRMVLVKK